MTYRLVLFLLSLLLSAPDAQCQSTSLTSFINCVDSQNGTDNLALNGRPYLPANLMAKGHPYFQINEWRPGIVYINGNSYPVNKLKYNLSNYQLIVKHQRPNGTTQKVVLSDLLIDSFYIGKHLFVNQDLILSDEENSGYLEMILTDKLSFYRLQKKVFNAQYNKENPHGWFSNQKAIFYLLLDGKHHKITKKKNFLACFPDDKVQIKKYLKDHSLKWKKMTKIQFAQLLKFCNDQI